MNAHARRYQPDGNTPDAGGSVPADGRAVPATAGPRHGDHARPHAAAPAATPSSGLIAFLRRGIGTGAARPAGRDIRIDAVRGIALLVIFITHMPGNVVASVMPHAYGFSDAAEVFVMLAGISAVLAYGAEFEQRGLTVGLARIFARITTLYIAHIFLFLIVTAIVAIAVEQTANPLYIETVNIQPFLENTPATLAKVIFLTYLPNFLDILPLYIVLLALFPLIHTLVRLSPAVALALSAAVWQLAVAFDINLPNAGAAVWFFNPFAWQFLFTAGVVIGQAMRRGVTLPKPAIVTLVAIGVVGGAMAIRLSSGNPFGMALLDEWVDNLQLGTDKTNLAAIRVVHLAAMAWLFIVAVPNYAGILTSTPVRALASLGQNSLPVFCLATVLSIIGQVIMAETSFSIPVQLATCAAGGIILVAVGKALTWYRSLSRRKPASEAPSQPHALA